MRDATANSAVATGDALQARYWADDSHGFRHPDHPVVRFFAQQRWAYLASKVDLGAVSTALDVGCGDGFSTMSAPKGVEVTACDGSLTMLRRHPGRERVQADAVILPFKDSSFDMVFCWELLHHVSEPHRVLGEMGRVSRRWVVACEPNPLNPAQFLFAWWDPAHRWVLRFSRRYMVEQAGLARLVVRHFSRGGCVFPNRTPGWMLRMVKRVPYRLPGIGITNVLVCERGQQ